MMSLLRNLMLQDLGLKSFSMALAILIWFVVSFAIQNKVTPGQTFSLPIKERTFSKLPVTVVSSAEDVHDFRVSPKEVEVTVQGDSKSLEELESGQIHVIVNLTGIQAAAPLHKRIEVSVPAGVTHVRVDPQEVEVIFPSP